MSYPIIKRGVDLTALRKTITVDLPELECSVRMREMSAGQFRSVENDVSAQLVASIIDENGEPVFESTAQLLEMPFRASQRLVDAFLDLNGATNDAIEAQIKNSEPALKNDSVGD